MSRNTKIVEETYKRYGFKRQELTDFFHSNGKMVDFGLPPMNFEEIEFTPDRLSLEDALNEIDRLKAEVERLLTQIPCKLGEFRSDDPLLIAIQLRNSEWSNYDMDDRRTIPNQDALIAQLKEQYSEFDMKDVQARAIEKVACPIQR